MTGSIPARNDEPAYRSRLAIADLAPLAATTAAFTAWSTLAASGFSWRMPAFFGPFALTCVMAGRIGLRAAGRGGSVTPNFAKRFVLGFFLISLGLLILALALPLGLIADSTIVLGVVLALHFLTPVRAPDPGPNDPGHHWCLLAVLVGLFAASAWSQTAIRPEVPAGDDMIHQPWVDSYWHATQIRMFRDSRGLGTLQDFRAAGEKPLFYHYAGYLAPATFAAWTGVPAFLAYNGFMVPLGIFLTGLAAFALAESWWGPRAGLGATVVLLLLPDASVLGPGRRWLSYHWLQQISPTGAIGVAVLAVAWMFVLEGCRRGNLRGVAAGFVVAFGAIQFKAHLFVANALLLWVCPPLFLRGLSRGRRLAWLAASCGVFVAAVAASQRLDRVPLLRPGRAAARLYLGMVIRHDGGAGLATSWIPDAFGGRSTWVVGLGAGWMILFFGTFGLLGLLCLGMASLGCGKVRPILRIFPIAVIANYLTMATLLLPDDRNVATPEELQHRPLVWAYFVVATWVGSMVGGGGLVRRLGSSRPGRFGLVAGTIVLLAVPIYWGRDVIRGPGFGREMVRQVVPRGLLDCCRFLREHAGADDRIQDSSNDPIFLVSALAERQAFAVRSRIPFTPRPRLLDHLAEHDTLRRLDDARKIRDLARQAGLTWYLLRPGDRVAWPGSIRNDPAFQSRGYRVYRLLGADEAPSARRSRAGSALQLPEGERRFVRPGEGADDLGEGREVEVDEAADGVVVVEDVVGRVGERAEAGLAVAKLGGGPEAPIGRSGSPGPRFPGGRASCRTASGTTRA